MIYVLMLYAIILTMLCLIINRKDILSPAFLFCVGFAFAICWAAAFSEKWGFNMHSNTFLSISLSMTVFVFTAKITQFIFHKAKINGHSKLIEIRIEKWKMLAYIGIEIGIMCLSLIDVLGSLSSFNIVEIGAAITSYRASINNGMHMNTMPGLDTLRTVVLALGYWFIYTIINNFILTKKIRLLQVFIVVIAMLSSLITGGRGDAIYMLLSIPVLYVILRNLHTGTFLRINFKIVHRVLIISVLVLILLWYSSIWIRGQEFSVMDYLSIYCGAEIMNLDMNLQEAIGPSQIWGGQTFFNLVHWWGPLLGIDTSGYKLYNPYRYAKGYSLGNVGTMLHSFSFDFGYIGMIIMVIITAFWTQLLYENVKTVRTAGFPRVSVLLYQTVCCMLALSFFSNKLYETVFSQSYALYIFIWWLANLLFCRVRFKVKTHSCKS